jgi:hypothetical protein
VRVRRHLIAGTLVLACATPEPDVPAQPTSEQPHVVVETPPPSEAPEQPTEPSEAPSEDPPEPEVFTPATRGSGKCEVTVSALLEAEEYRGPGPLTPAVAASLNADPDYARRYNSESHGDHHIQCVFQVELGHLPGQPHRWMDYFNNVLRDKTTKACNGMAAEVAEDIIRTTKDCTDFAAGAYWGHVLEPIP